MAKISIGDSVGVWARNQVRQKSIAQSWQRLLFCPFDKAVEEGGESIDKPSD